MNTSDINMIRGQTLAITFTAKNISGKIDLTGASVFMHVRADMKVDASLKLASAAAASHRVGIAIDVDQVGSGKGRFVVTLIPADTETLVALGHDDPYFYDVWVRLGDGSEFPVVTTSKLNLYPQVTTVP